MKKAHNSHICNLLHLLRIQLPPQLSPEWTSSVFTYLPWFQAEPALFYPHSASSFLSRTRSLEDPCVAPFSRTFIKSRPSPPLPYSHSLSAPHAWVVGTGQSPVYHRSTMHDLGGSRTLLCHRRKEFEWEPKIGITNQIYSWPRRTVIKQEFMPVHLGQE